MAKTRMLMPDVVEVLCRASARKEPDFNPQSLANALWTMAKTRTQMPMSSRSHAGHQPGRSRTPTRKILPIRFGPWRRLACRCLMSSRFQAGLQHSQFGQHDLGQFGTVHCSDCHNLPRRLSVISIFRGGYHNVFGCSGAFAAAFPQASSPKGKGVWLFPPLGSPAFPSGVGPLMSLIPVKAIRAVGVCVVDAGPAGSDVFFFSERPQLCQPRLCQRCREGKH